MLSTRQVDFFDQFIRSNLLALIGMLLVLLRLPETSNLYIPLGLGMVCLGYQLGGLILVRLNPIGTGFLTDYD